MQAPIDKIETFCRILGEKYYYVDHVGRIGLRQTLEKGYVLWFEYNGESFSYIWLDEIRGAERRKVKQ